MGFGTLAKGNLPLCSQFSKGPHSLGAFHLVIPSILPLDGLSPVGVGFSRMQVASQNWST